ncbi:MAG: alpha-amylase family glycosyl hydrolase, partial [Agathobaculum sp.]|uniref:alpha-amylase family glycosyl hydrolase n=1 Tax=Agathobaculum sp. TaxID=2048138 RepID=UPI003D8EA3D5
LNAAAKREKPDAVIIGEVWEDASNKIAYSERRRYFQGGELDSVMNYPLRDAILAFLNGGTAEHFAEQMETLRENYPRDVFYNLMNIIGTHDTARALTILGVSDEEWHMDRDGRAHYTLPPERLARARSRLKLAAVMQFTMPGSPTIYYADEAGRQGFEDPFNRRTYPWGAEDRDMLAFYRRLCELRAESETLTRGELRFLPSSSALLAYERSGTSRIVVLVNRGRNAECAHIDALFAVDMISTHAFEEHDEHGVVVTVPPETAYILRCFGTP